MLITADLNLQERKWLESRYRYPTFFVKEYINDNQVWDLLFRVCTKNFGWLDLDGLIYKYSCWMTCPITRDRCCGRYPANMDYSTSILKSAIDKRYANEEFCIAFSQFA